MAQENNEIKPGQSIELLQELHILTRDAKLNQDSRRKLKQIYHLFQFVEPLIKKSLESEKQINMVDHGAGKSYLGFIIYDLLIKKLQESHIFGIETRPELIKKSQEIAQKMNFSRMHFLNLSVADSITSNQIPAKVDLVTALHACDTATDDAIDFAFQKNAKHLVLIPCCQAEVAATLKKHKAELLHKPQTELWRHALHTREFGSHLTNVLRCLRLESMGYQVTVTEFTGLEHSLKNELIIATKIEKYRPKQADKLHALLEEYRLSELSQRFQVQPPTNLASN